MPWLSIIIAIVSFFLSKASGLSTGASLAIAAGAGVGTYLLANDTAWGKANLAQFDGGTAPPSSGPTVSAGGGSATGPLNTAIGGVASTIDSLGQSAGGVLSSWGGTGTAAVIGTASVASSPGGISGFISKYGTWLLLAGGAYLVLKN